MLGKTEESHKHTWLLHTVAGTRSDSKTSQIPSMVVNQPMTTLCTQPIDLNKLHYWTSLDGELGQRVTALIAWKVMSRTPFGSTEHLTDGHIPSERQLEARPVTVTWRAVQSASSENQTWQLHPQCKNFCLHSNLNVKRWTRYILKTDRQTD